MTESRLIAIIVGPLLLILIPLIRFLHNRRGRLAAYYDIVWKTSSSLKPREVLGMRPFNKYYYRRAEDKLIAGSLNRKENVLVVGPPLSGKSRAIYQALTDFSKAHDVTIPKCIGINQETFLVPNHLRFWRPRIILLDDLHRIVEEQNFELLIKASLQSTAVIAATCRSGIEYRKARNRMADKNMDLEMMFANIVELNKVSEDAGRMIANEAGITWDKVAFDGTVGSIFMRLVEMEKRFDECTVVEKTILRAIRSLHICGMYERNQIFPLEWIRLVAKRDGLEGEDFRWRGWLESLEDRELVILARDEVQAEDVYLEYIVKPSSEMSKLDVFKEMITTFAGVPDALLKLGNRACAIGTVELEKAEYVRIGIKAFEEVLETHTPGGSRMHRAVTQNNLGNAYGTLAEVEAKAENCKKAVSLYEQALKVYTLDRFPVDYAMTQNNLGVVYRMLAEVDVEAKADNCRKAIKACEEALQVYTLGRYPMDYAMTQDNLANAYRRLAEVDVEGTVENCNKAIKAHEEALRVYTLERSPMDYATTQTNLGNAYTALAKVEAKAENCGKAIRAHAEALKVRTLECFPVQYALTQSSLGYAYTSLAEAEERTENCNKAIRAFGEALKVATLERFPMQYATTQNNLGNAYRILAEVEDKAENCRKAIEAYKQALKVRTRECLPADYAATQNNLGNSYATLAEAEAKAENCKKAVRAYKDALTVRTLEHSPIQYAMTQNNLGNAYRVLAEAEEAVENCKNAIGACEEALKVNTLERFPIQYATTQNNLGNAYRLLAEVEDKTENYRKAATGYNEALKVYAKEGLTEDHRLVAQNLELLRLFCEGSHTRPDS